ncbi:MAG: (2Fe-2S) ferredoxin domain-containing protein [Clostridiales bacterium]|jgi:NADP-reducing hydrogenase subunit HndB|nr:(2Fe-2S) ferredoxin domain-containing protein [Clostridiales bacterium]
MKSLEELREIRERMRAEIGLDKDRFNKTRVVVGMATCGLASGAKPVFDALSNMVNEKGLTNVSVVPTGCIGLCQYEPIVEVIEPGKDKVTYIKMTPEKVLEIVDQHLVRGNIVRKYTISEMVG